MKKIPLTGGKFAIVDDEDFDYLNQFKWYCNSRGYAVREVSLGNFKHKHFRMHRVINKTPEGMETDHIDRNRLNNQKSNLRSVTHNQNCLNQGMHKNNTSGVTGVHWQKEVNKWRVRISANGERISLGLYDSFKKATEVRKLAEQKYHLI